MKKKLSILMVSAIVLSILFLLSACTDKNNKLYDIQHQIQNYTDVKCVTEKEKYSKDDTVIRYTLTNVTDGEAWINSDDACFELQKQVDGEWKWVGEKIDHYWTEMAMLLSAGESETRQINLEDYFYLPLEEGTYRIEVEGILSNTFEISSTAHAIDYEKTVSYANWSENPKIYSTCLNRGQMSVSSVEHCPIFKLESTKELENFKASYGDVLAMTQSHDEMPSFETATAKYDEKFFEKNTLFVVYVTAGSGTYRFDVDSVYCDDDSFCVHIKQTNNPEVVTMDEAGWFVTVAVKDDLVRECEFFDADLVS